MSMPGYDPYPAFSSLHDDENFVISPVDQPMQNTMKSRYSVH